MAKKVFRFLPKTASPPFSGENAKNENSINRRWNKWQEGLEKW
nr:MAG TPA: hypothetical protein [Caudoviricetes sp.]